MAKGNFSVGKRIDLGKADGFIKDKFGMISSYNSVLLVFDNKSHKFINCKMGENYYKFIVDGNLKEYSFILFFFYNKIIFKKMSVI